MSLESGDSLLDFTERLPGKAVIGEQDRNNRIINSSMACLGAYSIVYVSFNLITSLFAKRYNLLDKRFFYFFKVKFSQDYSVWTTEAVLKTFFWPPFICLLLGALFLFVQKLMRKRPGIMKLFWLWLSIHYLNFFCTQMALMPLKSNAQGINASYLGVVADYLFWEDFTKIIFSIVASLLMILIGFLTAKPFIQISNSTHHVYTNEHRIYYLFQMVFVPYLVTSAISLIYFADGSFILNISLICTLFVTTISLFINAMKNRMIMIYRLPETGLIENRFLVILASVLIFMKIFLNNGIQF